ncbi:hypothetical protein EG68_10155 [Paragonimus skrjabini miyazakii]|uniref:F-box domain-containing protein n=1 Tax=Paragonimus skrjabini miyazakii TaxID=59628 RepID=A0A8S9YIW6_9TREM|nr:hypothetical protein EG68_10155 [Paragonimus skrjabini miyazakii]
MFKVDGDAAKDRLKSSWTPLNDHTLNSKLFEERRGLINSWFRKWSNYQRKQVFLDLLSLCSEKQIEYVENILRDKVPTHQVDFTRLLPRVLSLYILSFLDPRSLCRCAQVCWYWKYLAESNELWAPKCIKRGWTLSGTINGFELGIWKKHYIQNMRYLQLAWPMKVAAMDIMAKLEEAEANAKRELELHRRKTQAELRAQQFKLKLAHNECGSQAGQKSVPWRGPDKRPTETKRLNYFDNPFIVQSNSGQSQPRRNTSCGRIQTNTNDDSHPRRTPDRTNREIQVSLSGSRPHSTESEFVRVNPMVTGPKIPWKPTSKHPKIQSSTNLEETGRLNGSIRQPKRRPSPSAGLKRHSPEDINDCCIREQNTLGLTENAGDVHKPEVPNGITTEEPQLENVLPPPPPYTKSHLQRPPKEEVTQATEELSGFSVPLQQTPVRLIHIGSIESSFTSPLYAPEPKPRREAIWERDDDYEGNGDHKMCGKEHNLSKNPPDTHLSNVDYEAVEIPNFNSARATL